MGKISAIEFISGTIYPSEKKTYDKSLDNTVNEVYFSVFWQDSTLNMTLKSPQSAMVDSTYAGSNENVSFYQDEFSQYFNIQNPEIGEWKLEIDAVCVPDSGTRFLITEFLLSEIFLTIHTDKEIYSPQDSIKILAYVGTDDSSFTGLSVMAEITDPDSIKSDVLLVDDGQNFDSQAEDGVYSGLFLNTELEGSYFIDITASGTYQEMPFFRQLFHRVSVSDSAATGIGEFGGNKTEESPSDLQLFQNYPNPFNHETAVDFKLSETAQLTLSIYDIDGRLVQNLISGTLQPGYHSVEWKAFDQPTGIYFIKIETKSQTQVKKCLLIK